MIFGKSDQILLGVPHQDPLPKWGRFIRALRTGHFVWSALLIILLGLTLYLWSKATVTPTQPLGFLIKYLWLVPAVVLLTATNLAIRWLRWHFLMRRFHLRLSTHFTFLPGFTPRLLLPALTKLEYLLECTAQNWSAHYMAHLIKDGGS